MKVTRTVTNPYKKGRPPMKEADQLAKFKPPQLPRGLLLPLSFRQLGCLFRYLVKWLLLLQQIGKPMFVSCQNFSSHVNRGPMVHVKHGPCFIMSQLANLSGRIVVQFF